MSLRSSEGTKIVWQYGMEVEIAVRLALLTLPPVMNTDRIGGGTTVLSYVPPHPTLSPKGERRQGRGVGLA
jgi:hypothetical protein